MMKSEGELATIILSGDGVSLCRVCLSQEDPGGSVEIHQQQERGATTSIPSVQDQIALCTRIVMTQEKNHPSKICKSCLMQLHQANQFRINCERSEAFLNKIFNKHAVKKDPEVYEAKEDVIEGNMLKFDKLVDLSKVKLEGKDEEILEQPNLDDYVYDEDTHMDDVQYGSSDDDVGINILKMTKWKKKKSDRKVKKKVKGINKKKSRHKDKTKRKQSETFVLDIPIKSEVDDIEIEQTKLQELIVKEEDLVKPTERINCEYCDRSFTTEKSVTLHKTRIHDIKVREGFVTGVGPDKRYCCTWCDFKAKRRQTLEYHMSRHTGVKRYKCDECHQHFSQHSSLSAHKKTHSDVKEFTCEHCGREFKFKHIFIRHQLVHTNERKYKCEICNKGLKSKTTLNVHMDRHRQIKNYSCHICALMFVSLPDLSNHMISHKKSEKNFKCEVCSYTTYSKRMLSAHIFRHTASRDFQCDQCSAAFQTVYALNIHKRKHSKENNYPCPICSTMFRYSYSVNKHMLTVHKQKFTWNDTIDRRVVK